MNEQKEIAAYLDIQHEKYAKIIETIKKEREVLDEFNTRLISDVVTGKIDVRGIEVPDFEYVVDETGTISEEDVGIDETGEQEE